jgi:uncharacterized protein YndB with AHSA1/START domain
MADIFHYFSINAPHKKVFQCVSTPKGINIWWSKGSNGKPAIGETYGLFFGDDYNWEAVVSKFVPDREFELTMTNADMDWINSKIGFKLTDKNNMTEVHFYHTGWKEDNEHYRISNYCWAMYLRILKRNLEFGEEVPYEDRLGV